MCSNEREQLEALQATHKEVQLLRQQINNERLKLPVYLYKEKQYKVNDTTLTVQPQSHNVEKISTIIAQCASTGGVLTLGDRTFNLPIGITTLNFTGGFLLNPSDTRSVTQSTAGILSLELLGEEIPTRGIGGY